MADTSIPNLPRASAAVAEPTSHDPDARGHFGVFGGRYIPEALMAVIEEVTAAYEKARSDQTFLDELDRLQTHYAGRPSPLYEASRLSEHAGGARIFLKREDLNHTGSHKINNVLGQALLARQMGKTRVIAETGAGQHGVATATACALLGLECVVYMGAVDTARQALNVARMRLLGAEVVAVQSGSKMLDHSYLLNASLWDSFYFSSATHCNSAAFDLPRTRAEVIEDFFLGKKPMLNARLVPWFTGDGSAAVLRADPAVADWSRSRISFAGGAPGVNALMSGGHGWTIIVLANLEPPAAERIGRAIDTALLGPAKSRN
jgi:hypothetical protein